MHVPLNALKAFEAAARHLSFRKAAEELHVTPAAISQQIRTLEDLVGSPLFERTGRGLKLTLSGSAGLEKLSEGLTSVSEAYHLMRGKRRSTRLTLVVAPSLCTRWLLPRLQDCMAVMPDIDLAIETDNSLIGDTEWAQSISNHPTDTDDMRIVIRFGSGNYPGHSVERLLSATVSPLCSPNLLQASDVILNAATAHLLHEQTLLYDDTPYEGKVTWSDWLAEAGLPEKNAGRGLHLNNVSLALDAAANGQGVVLSILELAQNDLTEGRLVIPFGPAVSLPHAWYVVCPESIADSQPVKLIRQWLLVQAADMPKLPDLPYTTKPNYEKMSQQRSVSNGQQGH